MRRGCTSLCEVTGSTECLRGAHAPRVSQSAPSPTAPLHEGKSKGPKDVVGGGAVHDTRGACAPQAAAYEPWSFGMAFAGRGLMKFLKQ